MNTWIHLYVIRTEMKTPFDKQEVLQALPSSSFSTKESFIGRSKYVVVLTVQAFTPSYSTD